MNGISPWGGYGMQQGGQAMSPQQFGPPQGLVQTQQPGQYSPPTGVQSPVPPAPVVPPFPTAPTVMEIIAPGVTAWSVTIRTWPP